MVSVGQCDVVWSRYGGRGEGGCRGSGEVSEDGGGNTRRVKKGHIRIVMYCEDVVVPYQGRNSTTS